MQAANVLLKNTIYGRYGQIAKLSDFGLANILTDGATHRSTGRMGTITHQAPGAPGGPLVHAMFNWKG